MLTSTEINELAAALAAAQGDFQNAPRSGFNTYTGQYYSTLADVLNVCREPLSRNGLSFIQTPEITDGHNAVAVTSRIAHTSGQWVECCVTFPVVNKGKGGEILPPDAQSVMSALTYARRASLSAMLGIASDVDDDANAASGKAAARNAAPAPSAAPKPRQDTNGAMLPAQEEAINNLCAQKGESVPDMTGWTYARAAGFIGELGKKPNVAKREEGR